MSFEPTTGQNLILTVWKEIHAQGYPSYNPNEGCMYRGPHNSKCAVGLFLTDEEAEIFEGSSLHQLRITGRLPTRFVPYAGLLQELQDAHDKYASKYDVWRKSFEEEMHKIASKYNVELPPVEWGDP
jgi:hypothetical protein